MIATPIKPLAEAAEDLQLANAALLELKEAEEMARNRRADATRRVDAAQKAFDASVAAIKANPPAGSQWHAQAHSRPEPSRG